MTQPVTSLRCYGVRMEPSGVCFKRTECAHFVEWPNGGGKTMDACTPDGGPFVHFVRINQLTRLPVTPAKKRVWVITQQHQQQELF